jgi:hypothetical protein
MTPKALHKELKKLFENKRAKERAFANAQEKDPSLSTEKGVRTSACHPSRI